MQLRISEVATEVWDVIERRQDTTLLMLDHACRTLAVRSNRSNLFNILPNGRGWLPDSAAQLPGSVPGARHISTPHGTRINSTHPINRIILLSEQPPVDHRTESLLTRPRGVTELLKLKSMVGPDSPLPNTTPCLVVLKVYIATSCRRFQDGCCGGTGAHTRNGTAVAP